MGWRPFCVWWRQSISVSSISKWFVALLLFGTSKSKISNLVQYECCGNLSWQWNGAFILYPGNDRYVCVCVVYDWRNMRSALASERKLRYTTYFTPFTSIKWSKLLLDYWSRWPKCNNELWRWSGEKEKMASNENENERKGVEHIKRKWERQRERNLDDKIDCTQWWPSMQKWNWIEWLYFHCTL